MKRALASLVLTFAFLSAEAQTVSMSVATGNTPTIAHACPNTATTATASATPATATWIGSKPLTGSQVVASITDTQTYVITCLTGGKTSFRLSWTATTKNTDGSAANDIAGYEVYKGTDPSALTLEKSVSATTLAYDVTGLTPGVWYFSVVTVNTASLKSVSSNPGNGTATAASSASASVTLKVPAATTLAVN